MNKNKYGHVCGWTMAELVVAMLVLAILMTLSIQTIKPKKNQSPAFCICFGKKTSATLQNLF